MFESTKTNSFIHSLVLLLCCKKLMINCVINLILILIIVIIIIIIIIEVITAHAHSLYPGNTKTEVSSDDNGAQLFAVENS